MPLPNYLVIWTVVNDFLFLTKVGGPTKQEPSKQAILSFKTFCFRAVSQLSPHT